MCGIVGVMFKRPANVGGYLHRMMLALQHRGTDSAGIAIYTSDGLNEDEYVLMVEVTDVPGAMGEVGNAIGRAGGDIRNIEVSASKHGGVGLNKYIVRVSNMGMLKEAVKNINATAVGRVYSYGRSIEIIKDIGTVDDLEAGFGISKLTGTHGIGHVRFSTESRVDRRHSHPFHSDAHPDIAVVHNGQITNYNKIRRKLERHGYTFETDNDTECIVHFIVNELKQGNSLNGALKASVDELDGPFSYIISTPAGIGAARDKLGLRPLMLAQDRSGHYLASEECALIGICEDSKPEYLKPGEVRVFERQSR